MAWFAGVICAGVVGALLWFAMPMAPVLIEFTGNVLRDNAP